MFARVETKCWTALYNRTPYTLKDDDHFETGPWLQIRIDEFQPLMYKMQKEHMSLGHEMAASSFITVAKFN